MKKALLSSIILTTALSSFAVDFGGLLQNNSVIANQPASDKELKLDQTNSASLWFKAPMGTPANYFLIQGTYKFEKDFGNEITVNAVNLDLAKFVYTEDEFTLTAGRFPAADLSGIVYSQEGDGCSIEFDTPVLYLSGYGFFTGLLNSQYVTIIVPQYEKDTDKVYQKTPGYIVTGARAGLPYFLGEQSVSAEGIFTFRTEGKTHTRVYAEGGLNGPFLINGVYYNLCGVLSFEKFGSSTYKMGNLSKGSLSWFPGILDSCVSVNSIYASGDQGPFDSFTAFTSGTAINSLMEPEYTEIFINGLSGSIKPADNILLNGGFMVAMDASDSVKYQGFQYNAGASWQIFSDVLAGAELTQYFASEKTDENNKTSITIRVAVTF